MAGGEPETYVEVLAGALVSVLLCLIIGTGYTSVSLYPAFSWVLQRQHTFLMISATIYHIALQFTQGTSLMPIASFEK